jgi:Protein of unknown function (DUF1573)
MTVIYYKHLVIMLIASSGSFNSFGKTRALSFNMDTAGYPKMLIRGGHYIDLGTFQNAQKISIKMSNTSSKKLQIIAWRSTCPCFEIIKMPASIPPGKAVDLAIRVLPQGYTGRIKKHMPITLKYETKSKILFLPLMFTADKNSRPNQNKITYSSLTFIKYEGGKIDDKRYFKSVAWLFGSKDCPQCNYLKRFVFPKLFKQTDQIVYVNLSKREGLMLLLNIEKRLKINKPENPPGLFWKNKMYYGSKSIKKLLPKNTIKNNENLFD